MKRKILIILLVIIIIIGIGIGFYLQQKPKISEEVFPEAQLKNLDLMILKNTEFKDFDVNRFSFKYPDWTKIEIDPSLIWPEEIAREENILLYLTNPDGIKILVTKRELDLQDLSKPYPLIFREVFGREREIMERKGGLTNFWLIREDFFENGIILESKSSIFGTSITSISKSVILREENTGFIYSVGISAPEKIFEDYRLLANYVINSVCYY